MRVILVALSGGVIGVSAFASIMTHRTTSDRRPPAIMVVPGKVPETPFRSLPIPPIQIAANDTPSEREPARAMAAMATWWKPAITDTWQWQLSGKINTAYNVKIYDVDLFDAPEAVIDNLRAKGRRVICYFSAGSSENWRPDFKQFTAGDMGKPLSGWAGERWLDVRSANVRRIMLQRLDRAVARKCDGVEPDNVDGFSNKNGLGLGPGDQLSYNQFLATEAHRRGLAVGLKNDVGQIPALVSSFDFAVNEQCNEYDECDKLRPFTSAGKPIFNAEYQQKYQSNVAGARDSLCKASRAAKIRTLVLPTALNDKFRFTCD
jgi:hypothetical protein